MRAMRGVRLVRACLAVGGASVLTFLAAPAGGVVQTVAFFVPFLLATVLLGARVRSTPGPLRPVLVLLWLTVALYLGTMTAWYAGPVVLGLSPPFPSPLDVVFHVIYVAYAAFLTVVLRRRATEHRVGGRVALTDSLIVTVAASAALWAFLIEPALTSGGAPLSRLFTVLYPALNLVLFAMGTRLAFSGRFAWTAPGALLLVWLGSALAGDTFYGIQSANGTFVHTGPLTATWLISYTALAALAAHPGMTRILQSDAEQRSQAVSDAGDRTVERSTDPDPAVVTGLAPGSTALPLHTRHAGVVARYVGPAGLLAAALVPLAVALAVRDQAPVMVGAAALAFTLVTYRVALIAGDLGEQRRMSADLGKAVQRLGVQRDQLAEQADELNRLAHQDVLTGLGNRADLLRRITHGLQSPAGKDRAPFALIMIDLDDFKIVNDSLGHETGDALLVAVAERLTALVGDAGAVTRLGGDEFAVVVPAGEVTAVALGNSILAAFARGFDIAGHALYVTGSLGITDAATARDPGSLLRSADLAMYAAKGAGKGTLRVFHEGLLHDVQHRLELQNDLRSAVLRGELSLAYQPIVDARTGALVSVEALARWRHPTLGAVPPDVFIPASEASGAIVGIGQWVLRTACRDVVELARHLGRPVGLAVNVSVRQLQTRELADVVRQALARSGLDPVLLTLEVTESLFMADDARTDAMLRDLDALGVQISIDDFGTGHSSLSRLRTLPVTELKIDRSFVSEIGDDGECGPIISAVAAMAAALRLSVVAEGVETQVQMDALRRLGCGYLQGYLLARPMPAAELRSLPDPLGPAVTVPPGSRGEREVPAQPLSPRGSG